MLEQIRAFFAGNMDPSVPGDSATTRHNRIAMATAALLLEMAHADSEFSSMEQQKVLQILMQRFGLSEEDTSKLLELAEHERRESLDIWQFTNMINTNYDNTEKLALLEILWSVVYVDGKVDMYEEYLMRKLSNLLNMDHSDLIEAKFRAMEQLQIKKSGESS
jgi:uncharacterized tellurite resistance protein B-like protein